jgi:hypothetical protein
VIGKPSWSMDGNIKKGNKRASCGGLGSATMSEGDTDTCTMNNVFKSDPLSITRGSDSSNFIEWIVDITTPMPTCSN